MTNLRGRAGYFTFLTLLLFVLSGCASSRQAISRDSEYQRMLDLQRQKADAIGQEMESKKLPEMGAEDHDILGDRYLKQGNGVLAMTEYQRALRIDGTRLLTRYKTGQLFLNRGLSEEAFKEFEAIELQAPTNGLGALGMGIVYFKKGQLKSAQEKLSRAILLNPNLWEAHGYLGLVHEQEKDLDAAITHYRKALIINNRSPVINNNMGLSYFMKGDYLPAIEAFLAAVQIDPNNTKVLNNLGLALAKMGRYREAFEAFKRGKDEATAYNNIGYIYMTEGKYKQATEALEKAIELKPQFYVKAHENREQAMSNLKDIPE